MAKARALTEEQWRQCEEPYVLLRHLEQHCRITKVPGGRRRLRLYACACCRRAWHLLGAAERGIVEVAERAADGKATRQELADAEDEAVELTRRIESGLRSAAPRHPSETSWRFHIRRMLLSAVQATTSPRVGFWAGTPAVSIASALAVQAELDRGAAQGEARQAESQRIAQLLRDIFHAPFQSAPKIDSAWLTWNNGTVARLARSIYDGHRFGDLPVLADALQEAGCTDPALIEHCRDGEHARGCWLVDLLLAKG
jgi:hypothetical protein